MKWAVLLIFGTIGLAAMAGGTLWGLDVYPVFRDDIHTRGAVVEEVPEKSGSSSDGTYFPVIEFSTAAGEKVHVRMRTGSKGAPAHDIGETVDVLYDPRNPASARMGSIGQLWAGPLATGGLGLILFTMSLLLFVKIGRFEKAIKTLGSGKKGGGLST